jgi:hypothetical protein
MQRYFDRVFGGYNFAFTIDKKMVDLAVCWNRKSIDNTAQEPRICYDAWPMVRIDKRINL